MPDPGGPDRMDEESNGDKLIAFPSDSTDVAIQPDIDDPDLVKKRLTVKKYLAVAVVAFVLLLAGHFIYSLLGANARLEGHRAGSSILQEYHEDGAITYENIILQGWYLDPLHEHFMATDGRKFTFVNSHQRKDSTVIGYWRIIE
jgi:hypothetical protein